ncbi:MAG: histidine phosphatase family protein [Paracoccaceae bacterium]
MRHGETEWNRAGRIQGQLDSDLTALGRQQARRQADIINRLSPRSGGFDLVSSPLGRTRKTAEIAFGGRFFDTDPRLMEINCGTWEGLTHAERTARDPALAASCTRDLDLYLNAPGGEGLRALQERLRDFLAHLTRPTVIVSHKVSLIALRGLITGLPEDRLYELSSTQGTVIRVAHGQETILV